MTDPQVVTTEGVSVTKTFDREGFPVPAVTLNAESNRSSSATLRITETVPDQFDIDQIGFHPDYGSDNWTAHGDGTLRFEQELEPGESIRTVYGIRMDDSTDPAPLLDEPTVEVDPAPVGSTGETVTEAQTGLSASEEGDETATEDIKRELPDDDAEIIGGSISGDEGDDKGAATPTQESHAETIETESAEDTAEHSPDSKINTSEDLYSTSTDDSAGTESASTVGGAANTEKSDRPANANGGTPETEPTGSEKPIVSQLLEELESGEIEQTEREALAETLLEESRPDRVRFDHLQSRVAELEAYTEALEDFIEMAGTADDIQELVASEITDLESKVTDLETGQGNLEDEVAAIEADTDVLEDEVEDLTEDQDTLQETVETLEDDHEDLRDDIGDLESEQSAIDETVEGLSSEVEELSTDFDGLHTEVEDLTEEYERLRSDQQSVAGAQETLQSTVERIDDGQESLRDGLEEVSTAHDELEATVESISSEVKGLDAGQSALDDAHDQLEERVGGLESTVGSLSESIESLESEQDDLIDWQQDLADDHNGLERQTRELESALDAIESTVADREDDIEAVLSEFERVESMVTDLESTVQSIQTDIETVESELESRVGTEPVKRLKGDVDAMDERLADVEDLQLTVAELESEFDSLEEDVERIRALSDQLSDVF